ncbi:AAA family ATPase [Paracoccus sp. SY]|uniref:AAA family ATPase n=1 Tax=Paracoccus sp. SY TaxID=1330255 RepID=UPI000CD225E6|nr:AAA family ATPase [Paracoccus sp. SY]
MKIVSLEAKNFRTLQDFSVKFSSGYCTISGENNAGKTAIVKIIRHFLEKNDRDIYSPRSTRIDLAKDKTQWVTEDHCEVAITLDLDKDRDS